jgi:hypothetical protein
MPHESVRSTLALAAALLIHILLILVICYEMQPRIRIDDILPQGRESVLKIRFIPAPRPAVSEPALTVSTIGTQRPEARAPMAPLPSQSTKKLSQEPAASPAPPAAAPRVFARDGSIVIPASDTHGDTPDYAAPQPTDSAGIMSHQTGVTYTQSRFEEAWVPRDENAANQVLRRAQDALTVKKTLNFGHGLRMHCAISVLGGGCGFGDAPSMASKKDGDLRLNMPPAQPLAKDMPNALPKRSEAECIAAYLADERVSAGCPADTPLKAVSRENSGHSPP